MCGEAFLRGTQGGAPGAHTALFGNGWVVLRFRHWDAVQSNGRLCR